MAKRSFASQLARGFVRSAVNQVGRDGGRVISNQIYQGQNYVPVQNQIYNQMDQPYQGQQQYGQQQYDQQYGQQRYDPQKYTSTTKLFSSVKILILLMISVFFNIIGGIGVIIYGFFTYIKRTDKLVWYEYEHEYVPDRRYKTGQRYVGCNQVKKHGTINASPEVIKIHQKNGKIAMIIGCVGVVIYFIMLMITIFFGKKETDTGVIEQQDAIEIVSDSQSNDVPQIQLNEEN